MIFSSTIIPTINRSTLSRAVLSVLDQDFSAADFEVIVVNDSGQPLPDMAWQHSARVRVLNTNRRERCVARNAGAAIAQGKYLHFLDDDDIIVPGALAAFWTLDQTLTPASDVVWLHGNYHSIDNDGKVLQEICPELQGNIFSCLVASEGIPFQTSLVNAQQFHRIGAFDPSPDIVGVEDRDVGRRLALRGSIAYTPTLIAKIRIGEVGSTTDWARIAERDRWGREKALMAPGAFARLRASAPSSFWYGRISRAYWASMIWNLQRRNLWTAVSRACSATAFAAARSASLDFWRGLRTKIK
jgi:glycosyltransferase involved in cell wall biosynthesis